jgi:hypothetical protein
MFNKLKGEIDKLVNNGSDILLEKTKNPFFVSLITAWLYYHSTDLTRIFIDSPKSNYHLRAFVNENFFNYSFWEFVDIILLTFALMLSYTFFSLLGHTINAFSVKVLKPFLVSRFDKHGYISVKQYRKVTQTLAGLDADNRKVEEDNRNLKTEKEEAQKKYVELLEQTGLPPGSTMKIERPDGGDHYIGQILDLSHHNYIISVKSIEGSNWRLGFKLSKDTNFHKERHSRGHPLIHLTKNEHENILYMDEYDEKGKHRQKLQLHRDYSDNPFSISTAKHTDHLDLKVDIQNDDFKVISEGEFIHYDYQGFLYAQLFAWGDGNPYKIEMEVNPISDKSTQ